MVSSDRPSPRMSDNLVRRSLQKPSSAHSKDDPDPLASKIQKYKANVMKSQQDFFVEGNFKFLSKGIRKAKKVNQSMSHVNSRKDLDAIGLSKSVLDVKSAPAKKDLKHFQSLSI